MDFPHSSDGKESTCNAGDTGLIPGLGRSPGEGIDYPLQYSWGSLVAQLVKNPPAMQETWVWSLGWKDPLEKRKGKYSRILAWRIPWTKFLGLQRVDTTEQLSPFPSLHLPHCRQILYLLSHQGSPMYLGLIQFIEDLFRTKRLTKRESSYLTDGLKHCFFFPWPLDFDWSISFSWILNLLAFGLELPPLVVLVLRPLD